MDVKCNSNTAKEISGCNAISESSQNSQNGFDESTEIKSDNENNIEVANNLDKADSSHNIFVELPIASEETDQSNDALSDSDDSIIFCSDPEMGFQSTRVEKPKDILAEVSDILLSLSDDKRFLECINYSNNNNKPILNGKLETRRSSVDLIFTYNVLNILYNKLRELKVYFELLKSENNKLMKESHIAEAEHVAYQVQIETLQKLIDEQKEKIGTSNLMFENEKKKNEKEKKQLSIELKSMRKKYEDAVDEKDSAVMRYVKNESELINIRKERENLLKRLKNLESEREDFSRKIKNLNSEKISVSQTLETKKIEVNNALKEVDKLKEELNCKDIKWRWVEENLQKDLNRYKEQNSELLVELDEVKKKFGNQDENWRSLPNNMEKHNPDQCVEIESKKLNHVEEIQYKDISLVNENNALVSKVQKLEIERLEYETKLMNLKQLNEMQNQKINTLQDQLIEMETLHSTVKQMQDKLLSCQNEIDRLKETNDELRQDMESCREREAEMLNFTEKLTAKNVSLQSDYAILEAKKLALEADRVPTDERVKELESKVMTLTELLENEIKARTEETRKLSALVEGKEKEVNELNQKFEEQQAENQTLKHKYSSTIRELSKEVQQYRKYKQYDTAECGSSGDSVGLESRTSSCNSLNEPPQLTKFEPDRQTLIERIVKLQKINAKHSEKIEFLEEHVSQLVAEIKKKNRVIQHYVLREQSGILSSDSMDQHKAELSKYGGIMASLYNPKCDNNELSLELSLEINHKLQAVLEDTILKNITLKDNIETLGKEIAKLTCANTSNTN